MTRARSLSRIALGAVAALAGTVAVAAPAHADSSLDGALAPAARAGQGVLDSVASTLLAPGGSAADCVASALSQPFAGLGDQRQYVLAPGGDFESGAAGWTLGLGARVVTTTGHDGSTGGVLALGPGAVAVSPPTCVDLDYPTARLWSRGAAGAGVTVLVSYLDGGRVDRTRVAGRVPAAADWTASGDLDVRPETTGTTAGWRRATFTFVAGSLATQVDDVYIDPRMH